MSQTYESTPAGRFELVSIIVIVVTVFAMALTDAFIKYASADMSLWQIYVLRSALVLPVFAVVRKGRVLPHDLRWVYLRGTLLTLMYLAIYAAIPILSLSVIAAALYAGPLFITGLAAVFLKRKISAAQWGAIVVGLVGVLVVLRPSPGEFDWYGLIPLLAALLYAVAATLTSAKCADEHPMVMGFALNVCLLIFGAIASLLVVVAPAGSLPDYPFLFGYWTQMTMANWQMIGVMVILIVLVSVGLARAYQSKKPEMIAAFDYSYLIFAVLFGILFFGDWPGLSTCFGLALILLSGLLSVRASRTL